MTSNNKEKTNHTKNYNQVTECQMTLLSKNMTMLNFLRVMRMQIKVIIKCPFHICSFSKNYKSDKTKFSKDMEQQVSLLRESINEGEYK